MNKIKKFKIRPHLKDITRRVYKSGADLRGVNLADETALNKFILDFAKNLKPGVIYNFFEGETAALEEAGVTHRDMFSVCMVTLGKEIETAMEAVKDNPAVSTIYAVAFADFLRTAVGFTADLIKEQAEKEEFETENFEVLFSPVFSYGPEPKFLREAVKVSSEIALKILPVLMKELDARKIDVTLSETGGLEPKGAIIFLVPWDKKKRRKK